MDSKELTETAVTDPFGSSMCPAAVLVSDGAEVSRQGNSAVIKPRLSETLTSLFSFEGVGIASITTVQFEQALLLISHKLASFRVDVKETLSLFERCANKSNIHILLLLSIHLL